MQHVDHWENCFLKYIWLSTTVMKGAANRKGLYVSRDRSSPCSHVGPAFGLAQRFDIFGETMLPLLSLGQDIQTVIICSTLIIPAAI